MFHLRKTFPLSYVIMFTNVVKKLKIQSYGSIPWPALMFTKVVVNLNIQFYEKFPSPVLMFTKLVANLVKVF